MLGAQKNCLIEMVLLSTHNICLGRDILTNGQHFKAYCYDVDIKFKYRFVIDYTSYVLGRQSFE